MTVLPVAANRPALLLYRGVTARRRTTDRCSRPILPRGTCSRTERMGISELLRWQWEGYAKYHQSRTNLLIHIVAIPLFLIGTIALVAALFRLSLMFLAVALSCIVVAVALQGRGHRLEALPPEPFTGPFNFVFRLFFEQWVTFPRFVISGGWGAALRNRRQP